MKKHLLPTEGRFYKGNMHCHSNLSDGECSPQELKELYKAAGYSVLAITDHQGLFYHPSLDDEDFLTIAGLELEFNERKGDDFANWTVAHLCLYKKDPSEIFQLGLDPDYDHPKFHWLHNEWRTRVQSRGQVLSEEHTAENICDVIRRYREAGFLVTYNHPKWSQEGYDIYSRYTGMNFFEIYNHGSYLGGFDEHNGPVYDDLLRKGERVLCVAADDNHRRPNAARHDMFGGFVMFKAPSLCYESIIEAFEKGDFYSSTGPLIEDIFVSDGLFTVKAETAVDRIRFVTGRRHAALVLPDAGHSLTEASFRLSDDDVYVRAELIRNDGTIAYTQAYFLDEIK